MRWRSATESGHEDKIKCRKFARPLKLPSCKRTANQERLDQDRGKMWVRRQTVEHPIGTLKAWMGYTHFLTKTIPRVSTETSLHVLVYNMKRMMKILESRDFLM